MNHRALTALRRACVTGRDAQTVTVRRGHLRELLAEYDRLTRPAVASEDTAYLGCMYCVSEGACPCAESECHYPTWERRVERVGPSDAVCGCDGVGRHARCYSPAMLLTAAIMGPLLRSDDPATIRIAIDALEPVLFAHDGNLLRIAKATGIAHRTLARWLEVPEFRRAVTNARKSAPLA